jgi:hypothetical protein
VLSDGVSFPTAISTKITEIAVDGRNSNCCGWKEFKLLWMEGIQIAVDGRNSNRRGNIKWDTNTIMYRQ